MKKKQLKKKKTLKTTYDDSSASKDEKPTNKEEVDNYAPMTLNDELSDSIKSHLVYDDLLIAFNDLYDECKLVSKKYKLLKKEHASLVIEFDKLKNEHDDSILASCTKCDEIDSLKKENALLQEILENPPH